MTVTSATIQRRGTALLGGIETNPDARVANALAFRLDEAIAQGPPSLSMRCAHGSTSILQGIAVGGREPGR